MTTAPEVGHNVRRNLSKSPAAANGEPARPTRVFHCDRGAAEPVNFGAASKTRMAGPQTARILWAERSDFYPKLHFPKAQPRQREMGPPGAAHPPLAVYLLLCMFKRFALA